MGWLFKSKEERQREKEEIKARVENSVCTSSFKMTALELFNGENGEYLQWLMANSKERIIQFDVSKQGVLYTLIEVNQARYRKYGTYDVDKRGYGFGVSGFEDLPNSEYVNAFRICLRDFIEKSCPVEIFDFNKIRLAAGAKKGW